MATAVTGDEGWLLCTALVSESLGCEELQHWVTLSFATLPGKPSGIL